MAWFSRYIVNQVGPVTDATNTPNPEVLINLTDTGGGFAGAQWFYAGDSAKREMLAVALAAISSQKTVQVAADPPNPGDNPFKGISPIYLNAS